MILTIDIGNTNIVLGGWEGEKMAFVSRLRTDRQRMCDDYAIYLNGILQLYNIRRSQITGAIISSVVPQVTESLIEAVEFFTDIPPLVLGPGIKTGLNIRLDNPAQTGSDIVADAVAAIAKYPKPIILFDLGSATTISAIDHRGALLGGVIYPGVRLGLDALATRTAQLPQIGLDAPHSIIGPNTIEAMKSGAVYGTASFLDGMATRIEKQMGEKATLVATGGIAKEIVPYCLRDFQYNPNLLLEGLRIIYHRNHTEKI
ncbi:MAG TPA: type III pantothenate kinase [Ruminococcaceae bacterium]|nr:type III pantothenate kinase [Oscillospiraceae bacterium]